MPQLDIFNIQEMSSFVIFIFFFNGIDRLFFFSFITIVGRSRGLIVHYFMSNKAEAFFDGEVEKKLFDKEVFLAYLIRTDHKKIGRVYLLIAFSRVFTGMYLSIYMRFQLAFPGAPAFFADFQTYNVMVTVHAVAIIFWFVMPALIGGFGNFILPLHCGIPDVAFPRFNRLSL